MVDVTVVLPLYNGEPFLTEALQSIVSQRLAVREIIVVDDGSLDDGARIAAAFGARVIRQRNRGVSAARNVAIHAARTSWIAFMDQDDLWHPEKNRLQCEALAQTAEASLAFTDFWRFVGSETTRPSFLGGIGKEHYDRVERSSITANASICEYRSVARAYAGGLFFFPSTLMIRRDLLLAAGLFDESLHYWGDYEFVLRALRIETGSVVIVEQPLVGHRDHDANASRNDIDMLLESIRVAEGIVGRPESYAQAAIEDVRKRLPAELWAAGKQLLYDGDPARASTYMKRAFRRGRSLRIALLIVVASLFSFLGRPARDLCRGVWVHCRCLQKRFGRRDVAA